MLMKYEICFLLVFLSSTRTNIYGWDELKQKCSSKYKKYFLIDILHHYHCHYHNGYDYMI